jgi:hypothetical protein
MDWTRKRRSSGVSHFQIVTERTLYSFNPTQCPSASAPSTTLPSVLLTRPGNTKKCIGSGLQLILRLDSQVFRGTSGSEINPTKSVFPDLGDPVLRIVVVVLLLAVGSRLGHWTHNGRIRSRLVGACAGFGTDYLGAW